MKQIIKATAVAVLGIIVILLTIFLAYLPAIVLALGLYYAAPYIGSPVPFEILLLCTVGLQWVFNFATRDTQ